MHEPKPSEPGATADRTPEGGAADAGAEAADRLGRPRFVEAELVREPGSRVRVRVELELRGRRHATEARGVGEDVMALRLAAEAGLRALEEAIGRAGFFELVGVKRIHAFDETVVLTCVRPTQEPGRRLLGCVPASRRSLAEATVLSILNATNRIVEWLPAGERTEES